MHNHVVQTYAEHSTLYKQTHGKIHTHTLSFFLFPSLIFSSTGLAAVVSHGSLHLTAPTGIAAINIGGSTIHSFAGIGLGKGPHQGIVQRCVASPTTAHRWRQV